MAYSEDLCIRLDNKVSAGMSRRLAAAHFAVSWSSAVRFAKRFLGNRECCGHIPSSAPSPSDPYGADFLCWLEETPDITLWELSDRLREIHRVRAPQSTIDN